MSAERSAIEEARANIEQMRQADAEQEQADREFAQMHKVSAAILEAMWGTRVVHLRRRLSLGVPLKALGLIPRFSRYKSIPLSDLGDSRELTTAISWTGESVRVKLESEDAAPSRSGGLIDLKIQALPEMLRLSPTHGEIHNRFYVENNIIRNSFIRRANLQDVARFQPVVRELAPRYDA